jgi:P-type conjugative transfer protein TrbG
MRNTFAELQSVLTLALALSAATAGAASAGDAVALPSRFGGTAAVSEARDDTSKMVEEWMAATGALPGGAPDAPLPYMTGAEKKIFPYSAAAAVIQCVAGMITDIELEPGERVLNFSMTEGKKWSVSAAWSGAPENMTTHVLLRTNFPGLETGLIIFTDRRNYSLKLRSSLDGPHTARAGFRYPVVPQEPVPYEKTIPPGRYRDLLKKYGLVEESGAERGTGKASLTDGAGLDFRYSIKVTSPGGGHAPWKPTSVYGADGRTFFVMPQGKDGARPVPSLRVANGGEWINVPYKIQENGIYVADRVFDEAVMRLGGQEVTITRR